MAIRCCTHHLRSQVREPHQDAAIRGGEHGQQQNPRIRIGIGRAARGGGGFYSCGRELFFCPGCGVLLALDERRNCGRWILGGGWGSHPASFGRTRDFRPSDPEDAVGAARWALWAFRAFPRVKPRWTWPPANRKEPGLTYILMYIYGPTSTSSYRCSIIFPSKISKNDEK